MIHRIAVERRGEEGRIVRIYNLETAGEIDVSKLDRLFCNPLKERLVEVMPAGKFTEVMYHNGVVDPEQEQIIKGCRAYGIQIEAAKVGHRYYGVARKQVIFNKLVHVMFTEEPKIETLKPRGVRRGMEVFDLTAMFDDELVQLSKERQLGLNLEQMCKLVEFQKALDLPVVTDVMLEVFGAKWSDHCVHTTWRSLELFPLLKGATESIQHPLLVSAFVDNAGGWRLWDGYVAAFKLETHNSPTAKEPYGGQLTKFGGVIRDILGMGKGAHPCGNLEMTALGEFERIRYPQLEEYTLPGRVIARETIRAVKDYGNPMGIPMLSARMISHPCFTGKPFALGGTLGIVKEEHALKGTPNVGDLMVLVGGRTGNDGLHGATISSGELHEQVDTGDASHVQIGNPYTEQKMVPASRELKEQRTIRAVTDCGAAGILMAGSELGEATGGKGGAIMNLAAVPLKCAGLENWQILLSESQERMIYAVVPDQLQTFEAICLKYELECTVIGIYNDSGEFTVVYDPETSLYDTHMPLSGEVCLRVPYEYFEQCPLPQFPVNIPEVAEHKLDIPVTLDNVAAMALKVVSHFDVCDQSAATTQYDSTVQGKTVRGPLYGVNYNIPTHLSAVYADYGTPFGLTVSWSYSPPQFESDPAKAAINAMLDAIVTQILGGVSLDEICLADNFYTPNKDPYGYYWLKQQVQAIAQYSQELGTPFITGKDSSSGSATYGSTTVNVLPSVAITALGRHPNLSKLTPHQWQGVGNKLVLIAWRGAVPSLDGSILSSSLGISGNSLSTIDPFSAKLRFRSLEEMIKTGIVRSAVPVNRGGLIMRLFEGVEASGFGVETGLCRELFPEFMGCGLVEIEPHDMGQLYEFFDPKFHVVEVGTITQNKGITVQEQPLPLALLRQAWQATFRKEVM